MSAERMETESSSSAEPSSPSAHSPPTSPRDRGSPISSPIFNSPPTPPRGLGRDSSSDASPSKHQKKTKVHRTTYKRRLMNMFENEESNRVDAPEQPSSNMSLESGAEHNAKRACSSSWSNTHHPSQADSCHEYCTQDPPSSNPSSAETSDSLDNDSASEEEASVHSPSISSSSGANEDDNRELSGSEDSVTTTSEEQLTSLYEGSEITRDEALLKVLKIFVEQKWTKASLDKNIKLIKGILPQPNEMPSCSKDAIKHLKCLTGSYQETEYLYCSDCLHCIDIDSVECNCGCQVFRKFYMFPIIDQIKHMFEQRDLATRIDSYQESNNSQEQGYISDIVDGYEYRRVKQLLTNKYDIVLLWNTDGVAVSSSSKQEMWLC